MPNAHSLLSDRRSRPSYLLSSYSTISRGRKTYLVDEGHELVWHSLCQVGPEVGVL